MVSPCIGPPSAEQVPRTGSFSPFPVPFRRLLVPARWRCPPPDLPHARLSDPQKVRPRRADAISVFEKTLVTPSRYDDFLRGNTKALSAQEQEGLELFIDKGCVACHNDINLGGTLQPLGVAKEYKFANVGGFSGNKDGMVKTPTLRNILETMPYFHNGQYWDVKDAIKEMASIQLGAEISDADAKKIETFFNSLTGTKPEIIYPMLPAQTLDTPKPDFK